MDEAALREPVSSPAGAARQRTPSALGRAVSPGLGQHAGRMMQRPGTRPSAGAPVRPRWLGQAEGAVALSAVEGY